MTFWTLIRRSLRFHARAHFGVVLGAAIGSAALIGALVVGDSVKNTLRNRALNRIGGVEYVLDGKDRLFSDATNAWRRALDDSFALALHMAAVASSDAGSHRANRVQLYGVTDDFYEFAPVPTNFPIAPDSVLLNEELARQLNIQVGDVVLLRPKKPTVYSSEAPLAPKSDSASALRLRVKAILSADQFGNFSPVAGSVPPLNAFMRLDQLQQAVELSGQVNFVLQSGIQDAVPNSFQNAGLRVMGRLAKLGIRIPVRLSPTAERDMRPEDGSKALADNLSYNWSAKDAGLDLNVLEQFNAIELKSKRIFLDPAVVRLVTNASGFPSAGPLKLSPGNEQLILTYLANLMRAGTNATPYSMVTAAGPPYTSPEMKDDEIILSQWLADDLHVQPGATVEVSYFLPESGASLTEVTNRFRVHSVVPPEPPWADRRLMPDFPGIEKAESTSDWDAGFPLVHKIRAKDEDYWKKYRGTPKAFVTLAAGKRMWANRFGELTAIRFPIPTGAKANEFEQTLEKALLANLRPEEIGLRFEPVREQALNAAEQSQDFGQLFLGFSIFLVAAALLLMALLFQFGLEQRIVEVGTLLALGFTARQVRWLLLAEGAALAFIGGVVGALGGLAYAKVMLWGLTTIWQRAVGTSALEFHVTAASLVIGLCAAVLVSVITIWLTLRKQARRPARELLAGDVQSPKPKTRSWGVWIAWGAGVSAVGIVGWALAFGESANAEVFFSAGALLLVAGLGASAGWLGRIARAGGMSRFTLGGLGWRGCGRRRTRSLATIALLASGCFVIAAIGVFRLDANENANRKSSGTGGFALIGEATIPVVQDLNTKSGREFFGLSERELESVSFVPLRVHEGDDASCLNLNRAQQPRLLGIKPELLTGRFSFATVAKGLESKMGWELLGSSRHKEALTDSALRAPNSALGQSLLTSAATDEIPAIGDANSIQWALHKKVGDTIDYTDEHGRTFKLRLVGAVANSILQGNLIIDEGEFIRRFPTESGHRMFLIDAPSNSVTQVSATLSRALQDAGLELTAAADRLNAFNAVQNTYLGTFQVLGGLGLLLGSAGLGVVVLRNVLERRGELGLLTAVGFRRRELQRLVLNEHGFLLGVGLALGVLAAAVAVLPALLSSSGQLPCLSLALTLAAVCGNGLLWTWFATRYALRGDLLGALRNE